MSLVAKPKPEPISHKQELVLWLITLTMIVCVIFLAFHPLPISTSVRINHAVVQAEVAISKQELTRGLMFRKELCTDCGMLFIFPQTGRYPFWGKNTLIPLSVAHINENGVIVQIADIEPANETPIKIDHDALYALEVNRGWFAKNDIKIGDIVTNFKPRNE